MEACPEPVAGIGALALTEETSLFPLRRPLHNRRSREGGNPEGRGPAWIASLSVPCAALLRGLLRGLLRVNLLSDNRRTQNLYMLSIPKTSSTDEGWSLP